MPKNCLSLIVVTIIIITILITQWIQTPLCYFLFLDIWYGFIRAIRPLYLLKKEGILMKYLYYNHDSLMNTEERDAETKAYFERAEAYLKLFETIKPFFSKKFISEYEKAGFHDYDLLAIEQQPLNNSVVITLSHHNKYYYLIFKNVVEYRCSMVVDGPKQQVLEYEILPLENGSFSHELSLSSGQSNIFITAKKLILKQ